jgi:hypothetical protein
VDELFACLGVDGCPNDRTPSQPWLSVVLRIFATVSSSHASHASRAAGMECVVVVALRHLCFNELIYEQYEYSERQISGCGGRYPYICQGVGGHHDHASF